MLSVALVLLAHAGTASAHNLRTAGSQKLQVERITGNTSKLLQQIQPAVSPPSAEAPPAGGRRSLYFRPVSTTLYCVMIMTIQSLIVYTGLSLLRNADELSARSKPSLVTETFAAASRTSVFPSMLCMLFVGCRMYVLATTEGLGEPPQWVKISMWAATTGMILQFVIFFTLPFVTSMSEEEEEDGPSMSDVTGGHHDVHPMLHPHGYNEESTGKLLLRVQFITIFLVYGGAVGVLLGVATFPKQSTAVSPAVMCTCIMSLLYFLVYSILWVVRTYIEEKVQSAEKLLEEQEAKMKEREAQLVSEIKSETAAAVPDFQKDYSMERSSELHDDALEPPALERQISEATRRWASKHKELRQRFEEKHANLSSMVKERKEFEENYRATILTKRDMAAKGMSMNMSMGMRKVPMMAVLFLAARMRALQLDPPYGMPPFWAQCCFFLMTGALFVEVVIAGYIGYTGKEDRGYYGTYIYHANPAAHVAQHTCTFLIYVGLIPVAIAIFLMKDASGMPAPLSPTVKCVMWFELMYFLVMIGQWLTFFVEDILKMTSDLIKVVQDTCLAAGVSLTCAPLLCILFVACRMRALQITQQLGNPPGWAQDCMFMCVFATAVQIGCCLMMPIFTSEAAQVDEDGNTTYDFSPMVGAYVVTVVKYIALMMLHGGVITVCAAVMVMTPEMCMQPGGGFDTGKILKFLALACGITLVALLLSSAKVVGLAVKFAIESCDDLVVGTQIIVQKAALSVLEGYVNVQGLKIENPKVMEDGVEINPWSKDSLLKVKMLVVKINIWRLVKSLGKEFEVTSLHLQGVSVAYEKWSLSRDSNVNMILEYMKSKGLVPEEDESAKASSAPPKPSDPAPPAADTSDVDVSIYQVNVSDIKAYGIVGGMPLSATVADIKYENFKEETGGGKGSVAAVVSILLQSILYSILGNFTNVGAVLTSSVTGAVSAIGETIGSGFGAIADWFTPTESKEEETKDNLPSIRTI